MNDDMLPEYDLSKLGKGIRRKFSAQFRTGVTYVAIDDDLAKDFPNPEAVNQALREYQRIKKETP